MPKGKRKDPDNLPAFKMTTFHIPPQVNTKNMSSAYQKQESQTTWARRTAGQGEKRKREAAEAEATELPGIPSGSKTIVIHPGSETLRIGRAVDYAPKEVPMALARRRRRRRTMSGLEGESSGKGKERDHRPDEDDSMEVNGVEPASKEVDEQIAYLRSVLAARTAALQLRSFPAGPSLVAGYNADVRPTKVKDFNDPFRVDWIGKDAPSVVLGEMLSLVPTGAPGDDGGDDDEKWEICRPIVDRRLSTSYSSEAAVVGDVQIILDWALRELLDIQPADMDEYSVILVVPDSASHAYLRALSDLLLGKLGFRQLSLLQESLGASFGAGLSAACVVDLGATTTTVGCVEDGLVVADTRQTLAFGGADLTAWFGTLLRRSAFPHGELNVVGNPLDFKLVQGLKEKLCTLNEQQVGVNAHEFWVRRPGKETLKFDFKVFDDPILCPMGLFDPRVFGLEAKLAKRDRGRSDSIEDDVDGTFALDQPSAAMELSTAHLRPVPIAATAPNVHDGSAEQSIPSGDGAATAAAGGGLLTPQPDGALAPVPDIFPSTTTTPGAPAGSAAPTARPSPSVSSPEKGVPGGTGGAATPTPSTSVAAYATAAATSAADAPPPAPAAVFDVRRLASQTALDVAVAHALVSAGSDDKAKKFASTVLVVGGGALVSGLAEATASRVQALLGQLYPQLVSGAGLAVGVVPPPREVDPRLLVWKGVSVFARLESVHETWVSREEWATAGMRALKDRTLFL